MKAWTPPPSNAIQGPCLFSSSMSSMTMVKLLQPHFVSPRPSFPCHLSLGGHGNAQISQSSNGEEKNPEIWQYFKEAQQNILYLNKQRLKATEEARRVNEENQLLRDTIAQLEAEKQAHVGKDKNALCWELLLRVDSLVLSGTVSTSEASDLRRLIVDRTAGHDEVFGGVLEGTDTEFLLALKQFSERTKKKAFHVVHICTEMEPLVSSVGCLASYVTGISRALQRKGHLVEVILPKYKSIDLEAVQELREIEASSYSYFNGQLHENRIWNGVVNGIGVTFIDPQFYSSFFNRERIYGYADDFERFSYFSRASLDYILKSGKQPDVLHIHNWETAVVGPLFWELYSNQGLDGTRILFSCHNFNLQCLEQPDKLALCGLDPHKLHRDDRFQDTNKTHLVNILKGGIVYANKVVIMSSMHSKSKVIHSLSHGLESTLNTHKDKISISPYGYDGSTWDPSSDSILPENYSVDDITGKTACKITLQQYVGLSDNASNIVVGCVFSDVSEVDLKNLKTVIWNAVDRGVQFVILWNDDNMSKMNRGLQSFQQELKDDNIQFVAEHDDEALLHLIFAGSDIILCQSFHDPLSQTPLKALRYGSAPIALTSSNNRLRNFVDHDNGTTKFSRLISTTFGDMLLDEALDEMVTNSSEWNRKMIQGMAMDFTWDGECCDAHVSAYAELKNL